MEPRAAAPTRRLKTIQRLRDAGVPVGVLFAPVIPFLNDHEMESVLQAVAAAGAATAAYVLLRLPLEVDALFQDWLQQHYPLKAARIMQRVRDSRGGKNYDAEFGQRMSGTGHYADLIAQRFALAIKRYGLTDGYVAPDCSLFKPPVGERGQMNLF
jgi:DNA repair photolyase